LNEAGFELSSANSINWGRLLPQIVYYFWSYLQLLKQKKITEHEKINFVVPTGNFGNILAGWYAKKMGLPIHKLVCASNENKVLTDFFRSGTYNRNREFRQTSSPSMDILISSNLERFLFEITGHDTEKITRWMGDLNKTGQFEVDKLTKKNMDEIIDSGFADEEETLSTIRDTYNDAGYILDTHTAVGYKVYQKFQERTGNTSKTVITATASPFKFGKSVFQAIRGKSFLKGKGEFEISQELSTLSNIPIHAGLRDLDKKPVLHDTVTEKDGIRGQVEKILGM